MKWSMCVCDTNTASMGRSVAAGVRSMRPRSTSSARPCQRSDTRSAGSPVCPFSRRGRKVVFMEPGRALMAAKADRFLGLVRAGAPIFPGVPTFVRAAAARVPLAVASGALRHEIELILVQAGLADCFAAIVSAEEVSAGKPSPEGFLHALERLRVRLPDLAPRDCLVVEDSQPGLEGARRAGMRCLAVTNSYPAAELAGADLIVSSLAEAGWNRLAALF